MQPFLYAIELDSLKKSDAHDSPEKQLLLLSILVNGKHNWQVKFEELY